MVEADHDGFQSLRGERPQFHGDGKFIGKAGDQVKVTANIGRGVALKIGDGEALKMPLHQSGIKVRAVLADGFEQVDHHQNPFPTWLMLPYSVSARPNSTAFTSAGSRLGVTKRQKQGLAIGARILGPGGSRRKWCNYGANS